MYSAMMACATVCIVSPMPNTMAKGIKNSSVHMAVILPKLWCQIFGANKGNKAMESRMQANGKPHSKLMSAGLYPAAWALRGKVSNAVVTNLVNMDVLSWLQ